jgi:hypothetical protein
VFWARPAHIIPELVVSNVDEIDHVINNSEAQINRGIKHQHKIFEIFVSVTDETKAFLSSQA